MQQVQVQMQMQMAGTLHLILPLPLLPRPTHSPTAANPALRDRAT